jgi:hypothetical protein
MSGFDFDIHQCHLFQDNKQMRLNFPFCEQKMYQIKKFEVVLL